MTAVTEREIAGYVERVREALADLPPAARDELLEDLPEHLAEVAAEGDGSLTARLGEPQAYAAELRAAAGVGAPTGRANLDQRINAATTWLRNRLRVLDGQLGPVIGYARASVFLRLLRPAWWVLRGYLVAMLLAMMFAQGYLGLLPRFDGSVLLGLLLLTVAVIGSIWLGRRSDGFGRRGRWVLGLGTGLLAVFGLVAFFDAAGGIRPDGNYPYQPAYMDQYSGVQDVYVYDREGRLVEDVRLFDQNGLPIRLGGPWCPEAKYRSENLQGFLDPASRPYPYCPHLAPFRILQPQEVTPAPTGEPVPSEGPASPGATPAPTTSPTPAGPTPPADPTPPAGSATVQPRVAATPSQASTPAPGG